MQTLSRSAQKSSNSRELVELCEWWASGSPLKAGHCWLCVPYVLVMERQRLPGQFCCALSSQELVMELPLVRHHFLSHSSHWLTTWVRKKSRSYKPLSMEAKYSQSASVGRGWLNLKILRWFLVLFWVTLLIGPFPNFCFKAPDEPDVYQRLCWLGCVLSEEWSFIRGMNDGGYLVINDCER